ncbi:MAG: hypothetical protein L3J71_05520 [Victivallaceae bacterium]|nr:hypothetical protein [Victivallaceae bacterium]
MSLYKNRYRVETTRLKNWDYSDDGWFFITICSKDRKSIFGEIINGEMYFNNNGNIVKKCWFDLPHHYLNLILGAFVVMPNHIHGIMIIDNRRFYNGDNIDVGNNVETGLKPVSTQSPQQSRSPQSFSRPISKRHGIFEFVRALKTFSSRRINEINNTSGTSQWQTRFYDHLIRNKADLQRVENYILNNPSIWEHDSLKISEKYV